MRRAILICGSATILAVTALAPITLPSGWRLTPPSGPVSETGTMPQGLSLSPDGRRLAVVESGFHPPVLRILAANDLHTIDAIPLRGGFGTPVWRDENDLLLAGENTGSLVTVRLDEKAVGYERASGWPVAVASRGNAVVMADDLSNDVAFWKRTDEAPQFFASGSHPADVVFSRDGKTIFASNRGEATVTVFDLAARLVHTIPVDLHPSALALSANGAQLYVACTDADAVDVIDTHSRRVASRISVALPQGAGASPNALALDGDTLYVSLGAENAIAAIRNGHVVARAPAGWYPSGIAATQGAVFVTDGKGEGSRANPEFDPRRAHSGGYIAATLNGSVRKIDARTIDAQSTAAVLADLPSPQATPPETIVRPNGPIAHIFYIIKENRTYDQVLGDVSGADGDPKLTWFGRNVTPNQHALVERFGVFDDTDADAQVSANGHNWSTAAFANDYLERFWPPNYGGRRSLYDFEDGAKASTPRNGYIWDDARKRGVSIRDYGEFVTPSIAGLYASHMTGLHGVTDPRYPGFDLDISDETRVDEWQREFDAYVKTKSLPSLEIIRLPNDHTAGTRPGSLTPQAYVAQNDRAFGRIVERISHSPYWPSSVILAIEDDAQNGPDHVDNQRTTLYVVSPYAAKGVHHAHYSTTGVVRTIEIFLGLPAMSIYDAVAPPLYDAFALQSDLRPFTAMPPSIDLNAKNLRTAYGAAVSARMNFSDADAADPSTLNQILAHAAGKTTP
ncbi:MAG: beta-propeller fold lactonase family protein [Candidatus Eremiobacteraeota bacterium]|nr:beta-propeller fold lactonase family protein [Candidatus Eremiobacteraeota bacterium]